MKTALTMRNDCFKLADIQVAKRLNGLRFIKIAAVSDIQNKLIAGNSRIDIYERLPLAYMTNI